MSGPSLQGPYLSQVLSTGTAGHRDLSFRGPGSQVHPHHPGELALSHRSSKHSQVLSVQTALGWEASAPHHPPQPVTLRLPHFPEGRQCGGGKKGSEMGSPGLQAQLELGFIVYSLQPQFPSTKAGAFPASWTSPLPWCPQPPGGDERRWLISNLTLAPEPAALCDGFSVPSPHQGLKSPQQL